MRDSLKITMDAKFASIKDKVKPARLKEKTSFPLNQIGIDEDLSCKDLFVMDIDKHSGIGGSLSTVYVWVENNGFQFLNDYLIPTSFLEFDE